MMINIIKKEEIRRITLKIIAKYIPKGSKARKNKRNLIFKNKQDNEINQSDTSLLLRTHKKDVIIGKRYALKSKKFQMEVIYSIGSHMNCLSSKDKCINPIKIVIR